MIKKFLFIFLNVIATGFTEDVSVNLSRGTVGMNESFTIEFSSNQKINEQPDFNLLRNDFDILSTSQNNSTMIINGEVTQKKCWILELVPKHEGKIMIPVIAFGNSKSPSVPIEVTAAHAGERDQSLYVETEISPKKSVYAQTQLIYTVRLYRSVNLVQGSLSDVKVNDPDAIIERIGNDVEYDQFDKDGISYIVLERKYAVYPQKEGELIFSPIIFEGNVAVRGNSMFNMHTKFKRVYSNQQTVDVKPIPAPFQRNNWLAAYDVKLSEEWSAEPSRIILGEPITWTVTISADGCIGSQIPPVVIALPDDIKQYQDKPQIQNKLGIGSRQTKIALIASQSGPLTIPELVIKWWDLKENRIRETKLPARTIEVEANQVAMNGPINEQKLTPIVELETVQASNQPLPLWAWALIGLNAIWIIGLAYFLAKKINISFSKPDFSKGIKSQLKSACRKNDAKQAEVHLLSWARLTFPQFNFRTIIEIKEHVSEEMRESIDELYQCLYGHQRNWEGDSLLQAFTKYKAPRREKLKKREKETALKSLYPN